MQQPIYICMAVTVPALNQVLVQIHLRNVDIDAFVQLVNNPPILKLPEVFKLFAIQQPSLCMYVRKWVEEYHI